MSGDRELGFIPQRENTYNSKLPHREHQDKDSNLFLKEIKLNLSNAVLNNDISQGGFDFHLEYIFNASELCDLNHKYKTVCYLGKFFILKKSSEISNNLKVAT